MAGVNRIHRAAIRTHTQHTHSQQQSASSSLTALLSPSFSLSLSAAAAQAIALLPFIDADRLRTALAPLEQTLTDEEAERNTHGTELLYTSSITKLGKLCSKHLIDENCLPAQLIATSLESPSFQGEVKHAGGRCTRSGGILPVPPKGQDWGLQAVHGCQVCAVSSPRHRIPCTCHGF